MKLASDFDGVWTYPEDEAAAQADVLDAALEALAAEGEAAAVRTWIADARAASLAEPTRFGWAPGGRVSAFADEDPFAPHSALLHYLHVRAETGEPLAVRLRERALERHGGLDAFGGWAHAEGVRRVAESRGPGVLETAAAAGRAMLDRGVEVVVVSNSGTDKLAHWFTHAKVPSAVHPERVAGALRLRGAARKWVLDPDRRDPLDLGGIAIETARPAYEAILRDERPGAVVGDVFSLDLALPLVLRRRDDAFASLRLFWLIHPYTPAWLRERVEDSAPEVECVEGGLAAVARRLGA